MSTIVMYGMGPADDSPRTFPLPTMPDSTRETIRKAIAANLGQPVPNTKDAIVQSLVARIDFLRLRLEEVEGMREELAVLERMLAATTLEPSP